LFPSLHYRRDLPSLPTRRSSDLATATALRAFIFCRAALVCFLDVAASTVFTVVSASAGADSEGPFTVSACAAGTWRPRPPAVTADRKSTRLNSSHVKISYAVFCL